MTMANNISYSHAFHNDILVNLEGPIQQGSHKMINGIENILIA